MGKINISLPDGLLEEVEQRAADMGVTRSGFLQEAAARYITAIETDKETAARTERLSRVRDRMRSVANAVGVPDAAKAIRELRDEAPRWEKR
ncbi:MAG: hypothetical protein CVT60_04910 [Actinobacteria bacterium HGW-Actinobacteria-10]|nr:MAG: hypothetical protein CVT60_04910 [Actinobacteria bacterium HGW-Actinobacteria-10]